MYTFAQTLKDSPFTYGCAIFCIEDVWFAAIEIPEALNDFIVAEPPRKLKGAFLTYEQTNFYIRVCSPPISTLYIDAYYKNMGHRFCHELIVDFTESFQDEWDSKTTSAKGKMFNIADDKKNARARYSMVKPFFRTIKDIFLAQFQVEVISDRENQKRNRNQNTDDDPTIPLRRKSDSFIKVDSSDGQVNINIDLSRLISSENDECQFF